MYELPEVVLKDKQHIEEGDGKQFRWFWERPDEEISCNKGNHRDRSIANAPQHKEHWKKEEKKREPEMLNGYGYVWNPEIGQFIPNPVVVSDFGGIDGIPYFMNYAGPGEGEGQESQPTMDPSTYDPSCTDNESHYSADDK